jgi:hypothetical protein
MMNLLRRLWNIWLPIGHWIGDWIARIVLTLFYFTIFLPYGLYVRFLRDPLSIRKSHQISWTDRKTVEASLDEARRLG